MALSEIEIWTIGHSTQSIEEFTDLLQANQIGALADVRRFPGSRRYPQFRQEALAASLAQAEIEYQHFPELGGRRRSVRVDSPNRAWRNAAFRGYADYMMTEAFRAGVERLLELAREKRTAIMCAEAVWWRCHRGMISDYLKAHGVKVSHIFSANKVQEHPYTSAANVVEGKLSYEGPQTEMKLQGSGEGGEGVQ